MHQGSVLSPLLFIMALKARLHEFCTGLLWQLLYAGDLVLIADTQEEFISKLKVWKAGVESKGLLVNMKKNKFLVSEVGLDLLKEIRQVPLCCLQQWCR